MHNIVRLLSLQSIPLRLLKQTMVTVQILKHLPLPSTLLDLLFLLKRFRKYSRV
jgi:hypothetical protein